MCADGTERLNRQAHGTVNACIILITISPELTTNIFLTVRDFRFNLVRMIGVTDPYRAQSLCKKHNT